MFLSVSQIQRSLGVLADLHPFYGIVYLACKKAALPIGISVPFPISSMETELLDEFYWPDRSSEYYYRVFRVAERGRRWMHKKKYSTSTLQSIRTQTVFSRAFVHQPHTDVWGWAMDYVSVLKSNLTRNSGHQKGRPIPAFHLAVWLYRNRDWPRATTAEEIVTTFLVDFSIDPEERDQIFDLACPPEFRENPLQEEAVTWKELRKIVGSPPDAKPAEGAAVHFLELREIGPAERLRYDPTERLNLITSDNSLGKTLLLECVWWALTGQWLDGYPAAPRKEVPRDQPTIYFSISAPGERSQEFESRFNWEKQEWRRLPKREVLPGLAIYVRWDGSIAVWDPARSSTEDQAISSRRQGKPLFFGRADIFNGLVASTGHPEQQWVCNGLIRDWVTWQMGGESYKEQYNALASSLRTLSPSGFESLSPGRPSRISTEDSRDFPTVRMPYGDVPVVYTSAAVQRVLSIAYIMVWAWHQHLANSRIIRRRPQRRLVLLVDEVEAHLHPRWQRTITAALLGAISQLDSSVLPQLHIATHSPMVMASAETVFNAASDALHHLRLTENGVVLDQLPFVKRGRADLWLMSDVFGLEEPRSLPAEEAIGSARSLQMEEQPPSQQVAEVNTRLVKYLAPDDDFWPEWRYFAKQHGVK